MICAGSEIGHEIISKAIHPAADLKLLPKDHGLSAGLLLRKSKPAQEHLWTALGPRSGHPGRYGCICSGYLPFARGLSINLRVEPEALPSGGITFGFPVGISLESQWDWESQLGFPVGTGIPRGIPGIPYF